jgi:hypothetical protein
MMPGRTSFNLSEPRHPRECCAHLFRGQPAAPRPVSGRDPGIFQAKNFEETDDARKAEGRNEP